MSVSLTVLCLDYQSRIRGKISTEKLWQEGEKCHIINGYLFKRDHNLVTDFIVDEIPGYNIFVGPYPQAKRDIEKLADDGINAVLNVQTKSDFSVKQINIEAIKELYEAYQIKLVHIPIIDFDEADLIRKLPK
jgi:hypothetical protein